MRESFPGSWNDPDPPLERSRGRPDRFGVNRRSTSVDQELRISGNVRSRRYRPDMNKDVAAVPGITPQAVAKWVNAVRRNGSKTPQVSMSACRGSRGAASRSTPGSGRCMSEWVDGASDRGVPEQGSRRTNTPRWQERPGGRRGPVAARMAERYDRADRDRAAKLTPATRGCASAWPAFSSRVC
jgi:hypothetical protein